MTLRRRFQLSYFIMDLLSAEAVWLCFLWFRWLVYEGATWGVDILVPTFSFYPPLITYPIVCICVYYLSGFYLRPLQKRRSSIFYTTILNALFISLLFFFTIIIDDPVKHYQRYIISLCVLFGLQFLLSFIPRVLISYLAPKGKHPRRITIQSYEEAIKIRRHEVEEVVVDIPRSIDTEHTLYQVINQLYPLDVEIYVVPQVYDMLIGAARIKDILDRPLIPITQSKMSDSSICIKRAFDIAVSAVIMVLLSPLYLLLTILVFSTTKGPAIYRQERIGLHGKVFQILKFRTMVYNAESSTPQLSQVHDKRITKVGYFLRKYRLDELPQMWNVFRGDMSIVGPRPERRFFIQKITERAPYYCLLYQIRPGLTSWGPIRVGYTDTIEKMIDRLNYDITYLENMSLLLDLKIILLTIQVIIDGKGQ